MVSGPFEGMRYVDKAASSAYIPKLVGSYELELYPRIEGIRRQRFEIIIDVGAAEGYYAVGLAKMFPDARVIAYEADADAHEMLAELARRNDLAIIWRFEGFALQMIFRPYRIPRHLL